MRAIGTIKKIDIAGLTEYVINRKEYMDLFQKEKDTVFDIINPGREKPRF